MRVHPALSVVLAIFIVLPVVGQDEAFERTPIYDGRIFGRSGDIRADAGGFRALGAAPVGSGLEVDDLREIRLSVAPVPDALVQLGLTDEQIRNRVESRLRSLNLQPVPEDQATPEWLSIRINGVGSAYSIDLSFNRTAFYVHTVETDVFAPTDFEVAVVGTPAVTWSTDSVGVHAGDMNFVLNALDRQLEQFLEAYVAANQP